MKTTAISVFLLSLGLASVSGQVSRETDKLRSLDHPQIVVGGELGRRIKITVENSLLNLDVDGNFLKPFLEKQTKKGNYQGLGLLIDATVRFAAHTRDERVIKLKRHLVSKLIAAQTGDGYLGEFVSAQRIWGWIDIQELAYLANGLLSDHLFFKEAASLAAARKQADYILSRWDEKPNDWPQKWGSLHMVTTGLDRFMFLLSEETGDARYRDFCIKKLGVTEWNDRITLGRWGKYEGHVYGDLARCLAQLDWYRHEPKEALLVPTRCVVDFMLQGDGMVMRAAREEHPGAILTVSSGGDHLPNAAHVRAELEAGARLITPHFQRTPDWFDRTDDRVKSVKEHLQSAGRNVPVYLQEEQRRGWSKTTSPPKSEFLQAAREAVRSGAAGWVFHTVAAFDLRSSNLLANLDSAEREVLDSLGVEVFGTDIRSPGGSESSTPIQRSAPL